MNKYGVKCNECGSTAVWRWGTIMSRDGRKVRFKCTKCGHNFYKGQPGTIVTKKPRKSKA